MNINIIYVSISNNKMDHLKTIEKNREESFEKFNKLVESIFSSIALLVIKQSLMTIIPYYTILKICN